MNIIFAGTSDFAVPSLEALIGSSHKVLTVITQQDKQKGRGRGVHFTPVKECALVNNLEVFQPEKVSSPESVNKLKTFDNVDALVVVAYGQKISDELLSWPKYGVVNVHGSVLPKYRGAAPIQRAVMAGETRTGVTTMQMDSGWDTGNIFLTEWLDIIPDEDSGSLSERLSIIGAQLLIKTLDDIEAGSLVSVAQDNSQASIARSIKRDEGIIDWSKSSEDIVNRIRGVIPRPGAYTTLNGSQIKIWKAQIFNDLESARSDGEITTLEKDGIVVSAGRGSVKILELQPESRRKLTAREYLAGNNVKVGDIFV